ncbi:MAG: hypothetical protein AAF645_01255 [Myxococcota bacterium]
MALGAVGCGDDSAAPDATLDVGRETAVDERIAEDTRIADEAVDVREDRAAEDDRVPDAAEDAAPDGGALLERYSLAALHPEGGAFDAEANRFFVGSLEAGTVQSVDAETGEETVFFEGEPEGEWWTLGIDLDTARRRLWVCAMDDQRETSDDEIPYDGYVWLFDLDSGERLEVFDLSVLAESATCTDVAVHPDGTAYVTDREAGTIYALREGEAGDVFATDRLLEGNLAGQNGIVVDAERDILLVVVYQPSRLVRVPLNVGRIREVNLLGDFSDVGPIGTGADGIDPLSDGSVVVVFTSKLMHITPTTDDWMNAELESMDVAPTMTDVIVANDQAYLLNGQALEFALGVDPVPFELVRADIP